MNHTGERTLWLKND